MALTPQERERLEMAVICAECKHSILLRQEYDGLMVALEVPLCGHQLSVLGRDYVTGDWKFKQCGEVNTGGTCEIFELADEPDDEEDEFELDIDD